jgi:hypothetical protein
VLIIVLVIVVLIILRKKNRQERSEQGGNKDTDDLDRENPLYGTYSRGPDGEGDYGDGDTMEMRDNNPYYGH